GSVRARNPEAPLVSLAVSFQVLGVGLSHTAAKLELLKSRTRPTLRLLSFCRLTPGRMAGNSMSKTRLAQGDCALVGGFINREKPAADGPIGHPQALKRRGLRRVPQVINGSADTQSL